MIHGKPPEYICVPYTNPTTCTNKFYQRDWEDAMKRVQSYMDSHNGTNPPMVWFRNLTPPTPSKSAFHLKVESALGKTFNTADELANILRNHPDYQYYYNDMKTPDQTLAALKVVGGAGANCVDISQVIMRVLRDMKYSNVNIWRGTFKCGGHVWVTYGSDNKIFDAAGMMKYGYPIGRYMCSGSPWDLNKNPAWLLSDDAKT
jgi:hypothetical protein